MLKSLILSSVDTSRSNIIIKAYRKRFFGLIFQDVFYYGIRGQHPKEVKWYNYHTNKLVRDEELSYQLSCWYSAIAFPTN